MAAWEDLPLLELPRAVEGAAVEGDHPDRALGVAEEVVEAC